MSVQEERLTAIADAIRDKDGTTDPIPANDFPARIRAISSALDGLRTISLIADPPEGGTVSGGGVASDGMRVTIHTESADGYTFSGWTEAGETVAPDQQYTFLVDRDRTLVARLIKSRLPDGYTELEYVITASSMLLYANIDIKNTTNARVVMDITPSDTTESYAYLFCSLYTSGVGSIYGLR